ncbi:nuclear transport factor 2 family protein [Hyphococcus sp. DH-69]|uniref:nuclear transport factor 2 family protein n=1 Tax=Hyphococcus formosus TaxID=3143534 RepID=UPI00398BA6EF
MRRLLAIFACLIFVTACSPDAERAAPVPAAGPKVEVVTGLMAAFNAHDADKMREYWHSDVTWIEITGQQSSVVTSTAAQLHTELIAYFEAYPSVSSKLDNISVNGNFVTAIERPVWEVAGERKSQASVVVYEIIDGKVKRFWYFPPQ